MVSDPIRARDQALLTQALAALAANTGIAGKLLMSAGAGGSSADAVIELTADGGKRRYFAQCKAKIDRESTLAMAKHQLSTLEAPGLLVTPYLSPQMAARCRAIELQFVDGAGNAYLSGGGMYVFVSGQKPVVPVLPLASRGTSSPTAMRMVFTLLTRPALLQASYRDIAEAANIALGSVSAVFKELAARGMLVESRRSGRRRLAAPDVLVDEWVSAYPAVLRPRLHAQRFEPSRPDWWEHADMSGLEARWSGEVAAFRMHGYLKPGNQMLYVAAADMQQTLGRLVSTHRLRPDPAGRVEIIEAFATYRDASAMVPPLLVYADLMATLDPRNREAAKMIRENEIQHVLDQFRTSAASGDVAHPQ
jgi:hypothetical protein